jgi:fimbrial chaperone protein
VGARFFVSLVLALSFAAQAHAASLEVVPTAIDLPAKGGPAQLRLVNHGNEAVAVQVEAFAWTQSASGETLGDSDDIVVSPPLARLAPLSSQIVRLLVANARPGAPERAFRVVVTQLPDPGQAQQGMRVLLQFSVPVFAGDGALDAAAVTWSLRRDGGTPRLQASNTGPRRAKFTDLVLAGSDGQKPVAQQSLVYVLAGATRSWSVAMPSGDISLEGVDDIAVRRFHVPLSASD